MKLKITAKIIFIAAAAAVLGITFRRLSQKLNGKRPIYQDNKAVLYFNNK